MNLNVLPAVVMVTVFQLVGSVMDGMTVLM